MLRPDLLALRAGIESLVCSPLRVSNLSTPMSLQVTGRVRLVADDLLALDQRSL